MEDLSKEIIEYKLKLNRMCLIKNAFSLGCFTVLAIVFDKWWLVLLSALFLNSIEHNKKEKEDLYL